MIPLAVTACLALLVFLAGFALGFLVARASRWRANLGEARVTNTITEGFRRSHVLLNNLTFQTEQGTTQIDHVLVADTGIFVIETKHYSGWIFGHPGEPRWTQVIYRTKSRFLNPIRQNYGHVKTLQRFLSLPEEAFISLVVFTGDAEFKTDLGPAVIKLPQLLGRLSTERPVRFDERTMAGIVGQIEMTRLRRSLETDEYHLNSLRQRVRTARG